MEIKFNFHWLDTKDLTEENSSLSLGWIELKIENKKLELFKERLCMVFITISDLIDFISSNLKKFNWVGVDGGEVCQLIKKNNLLRINYKNSIVVVDYQDFRQALIVSSKGLIELAKESNRNIQQEGAFIDIENSLNNMINTF